MAHPKVNKSPILKLEDKGFKSINNPTNANRTEYHILFEIFCLPLITKNIGTNITLILVINADVVGVESNHKPKFWKLYPKNKNIAHTNAPINSNLFKFLSIPFLQLE